MDTFKRNALESPWPADAKISRIEFERQEKIIHEAFAHANRVWADAFRSIPKDNLPDTVKDKLFYSPPQLVIRQPGDMAKLDNGQPIEDYCYVPELKGRGYVYLDILRSPFKSERNAWRTTLHEMAHHVQHSLGLLEAMQEQHRNRTENTDPLWEDQADYFSGAVYSLTHRGSKPLDIRFNAEDLSEFGCDAFVVEGDGASYVDAQKWRDVRGHNYGHRRAVLFAEGATVGSLADGFVKFAPRGFEQLIERLSRIPHPYLKAAA